LSSGITPRREKSPRRPIAEYTFSIRLRRPERSEGGGRRMSRRSQRFGAKADLLAGYGVILEILGCGSLS